MKRSFTFAEFFAGGGMARAGLGPRWKCLLANDIDPSKGAAYSENWGNKDLVLSDVKALDAGCLTSAPDLVWASFPCQDLSLAGSGAGLKGDRSGTFWPFWKLVESLKQAQRAPSVVVLENVCGALTSHGGRDFAAICEALDRGGYRYGALVMDAVRFLPQSRPRLFIVAVAAGVPISDDVVLVSPSDNWHSKALVRAHSALSRAQQKNWLWWSLAAPKQPAKRLGELIEDSPPEQLWHSAAQTRRLLAMMSSGNRQKVEAAKKQGELVVGCVFKRTRVEAGERFQRAEVRFDGVAGCLRTPGGGSSRQILLLVEGNQIRSRLMSPRETARLMGLPDTYKLPERINDAFHLTGDGVAVPVVRHLANGLLAPLLQEKQRRLNAA